MRRTCSPWSPTARRGTPSAPDRPPRLGLWGVFDVEDQGQAAYALVVRSELVRRVPDLHMRVFAPTDRPTRADRGEPVEALSSWAPARAAELDLVVAGGAGLTRPIFVEGPDRWHVTDAADEAALRTAGVDGPIDLTPHPAVLLPRHVPAPVLEKRLEYLRLMGWFPSEGGALVVETDAERILADHPALTPVMLPDFLSLEDVAAAVAASDGFVGSPTGRLIALAYGKPAVSSDDPEAFVQAEKAAPAAELVARLQAEVDAWLDNVAEQLVSAGAGPPSEPTRQALESELRALRRAHRARTERANAERVMLADRVARAEAELAAARQEAADLRRRVDEESAARAVAEAECAALHATCTFRWTASARGIYRRFRQ